MGRLRKTTWKPELFTNCADWQHAVTAVKVDADLQDMTFRELDYLFAVFASNGGVHFGITCSGSKLERWLKSVEKRSVGAAERYEARMRAHFQKYKRRFVEGYSLPDPPTPQLRVIYDSALKSEQKQNSRKQYNFSGPVCHWQKWTLQNVFIINAKDIKVKS